MRKRVVSSAALGIVLVAVFVPIGGCRAAAPPLRFAPAGTEPAKIKSEFALTGEERQALTPDNIRSLTQEQVDQIYIRLSSGAIPDGPYRGDLFFPRGTNGNARIRDLPAPAPTLLSHVGALQVERLGRAFWRGKAFFKSEGILRNRIEDIAVLKPIIQDADSIPKLTFDGRTTWLLFPARLSCGESRLDPTRKSIVIDYAEGPKIEGYRPVPDRLAGPEGLNIRDEVRIIRPGFYLGRAYFGERFALNFTLIDPNQATSPRPSGNLNEDCNGTRD